MRKTCLYALFAMLATVAPSAASLQLRWSTGSPQLAFATATRCTLIVTADSSGTALPGEWRLLWLADSAGVNVTALDSLTACQGGASGASEVDQPATIADSVAHQVTAQFCSAGQGAVTTAYYVLDQPAGSRGRLKVVALDPADQDSNRVIESNEVTYNGGVRGTYPPAVLRAGSIHPTAELRIQAVGVGLADVPQVEIIAPDTSWRLALQVSERSDTKLTAVARVAADLPPFVLGVSAPSGKVGVASLPADTPSPLSLQPACTNEVKEINLISHEDIQPKDFTIIASRDSFHVFYTRQDYNLGSTPDLDSKFIGHKRSRDLYNWDPEEHTYTSIVSREGLWDARHVWAPTIIKKPGDITYFMLYTGVDTNNVQRIGVATSTDLNVWTQDVNPSFQSSDVSWAFGGTPEFRDPFVTPDPDHAGRYLLYFITRTQARGRLVVGVARTDPADSTNLRLWRDPQPFWNTDSLRSGAAFVESPHTFKDPGNRWWLFYSGYNSGTGKDSAFVAFQTSDGSPADTTASNWSSPDTLYKFLGGDQKLQFWHASEYYRWASGYEYLMAFNDSEHSVDISQISWRPPHSFVLTDSCPPRTALDVPKSQGTKGIELSLLEAPSGRAPVRFRIHLPARTRVELAIFDIAGRRVRSVIDGERPAGESDGHWDGQDRSGGDAGAGVYFARLWTAGGQRVAKFILLR